MVSSLLHVEAAGFCSSLLHSHATPDLTTPVANFSSKVSKLPLNSPIPKELNTMEFLWEVVMKCSDSILCQKSGEINKDIIRKYEARSQVALEDALKKVENVDVLVNHVKVVSPVKLANIFLQTDCALPMDQQARQC